METLGFIGGSICITAIITTIFTMLVPNSKLDKVLRFAISLFFIIGLVSPFFNNKWDFHIDISSVDTYREYQSLSRTTENQFLSLACRNLEGTLERELKNMGILIQKIEIQANILKDNSISISKVTLEINKSDEADKDKILEFVKKTTGVLPTIFLVE